MKNAKSPRLHPGLRLGLRPGLRPELRPGLRPELRPGLRPELRPDCAPDCFDRGGSRYGKNNLLSEAGVRLGNFTRTLGQVLPDDCSTFTAKVPRYQI